MNLFHFIDAQDILETSKNVYFFGCSFHEDTHTVKEDRDSREDTDDSEDQCADWVCNLGLGVEEYN